MKKKDKKMSSDPLYGFGENVYECDHIGMGADIHVSIWAGDHTRIRLCKFCSNVAVGTIAQRTFGDAARESKEGRRFSLEQLYMDAART